MKMAILGDAHLIADDDPFEHLHARRAFFKKAWPSFQRLLQEVNRQSPDLVIFLGDLVDWFSPQNITFGLDLLSGLQSPWHMVPGNHDLAAPSNGPDQTKYQTTATRNHLAYWTQQGLDLTNRTLHINGGAAILLDSALSDLADGTATWLDDLFERATPDLLFTHVPIDIPTARDYILSVDPRRNMTKYVISSAPDLYPRYLKNRIPHVPGDLHLDHTHFHLCTMSITMNDPNRSYSTMATATIAEYRQNAFTFHQIEVE
jgi:3',5'-cyclic AMP phosphodiesterase CpdA